MRVCANKSQAAAFNVKIYASLHSDLSEGFVWLKKPGLPARCVVKIRNSESRRSVFCEALQFEKNFLQRYNQLPRFTIAAPESSVVMSGWYRARLGGLETQKEYALDISVAHCWWGKIRACKDHPQIVVRVAVRLGVLSVALGVLSVALGVLSVALGVSSVALGALSVALGALSVLLGLASV